MLIKSIISVLFMGAAAQAIDAVPAAAPLKSCLKQTSQPTDLPNYIPGDFGESYSRLATPPASCRDSIHSCFGEVRGHSTSRYLFTEITTDSFRSFDKLVGEISRVLYYNVKVDTWWISALKEHFKSSSSYLRAADEMQLAQKVDTLNARLTAAGRGMVVSVLTKKYTGSKIKWDDTVIARIQSVSDTNKLSSVFDDDTWDLEHHFLPDPDVYEDPELTQVAEAKKANFIKRIKPNTDFRNQLSLNRLIENQAVKLLEKTPESQVKTDAISLLSVLMLDSNSLVNPLVGEIRVMANLRELILSDGDISLITFVITTLQKKAIYLNKYDLRDESEGITAMEYRRLFSEELQKLAPKPATQPIPDAQPAITPAAAAKKRSAPNDTPLAPFVLKRNRVLGPNVFDEQL